MRRRWSRVAGFFRPPSVPLYARKNRRRTRVVLRCHQCARHRRSIQPSSFHRVSLPWAPRSFFGETVVVNQHLDFAIIRFRLRWNESVEQQLGVSFYDIFDSIPLLKPNAKVLNTAKSAFKEVCTIGFPLDSDDNHISVGKDLREGRALPPAEPEHLQRQFGRPSPEREGRGGGNHSCQFRRCR